jgi:hypothetical protein
LAWFAREADGALIGYFLEGDELERSVVTVDTEGNLHPAGRNLAEHLLLSAEDHGQLEPVTAWLESHGLMPKDAPADLRRAAEGQPLPKWT